MSHMFPDLAKTRIVFPSRAEEEFYLLCTKLPDPWRVYHSVQLSSIEKEEGLQDNEIDFVCYHPRYGALVIEVKGGRIRFDVRTNTFSSVNRNGESFIIKDPFKQAMVWKSRFIRVLKDRRLRLPVSYGVCMPSVLEAEFPMTSGASPMLLIGREKIKDLEATLKEIMQRSNPQHFMSFDDVHGELDKMFVGQSFTTKLYLRDYLDTHEYKVHGVEAVHETLITPIAGSTRLGVEGEAGTGKTLLALMMARHYRDKSATVLFLGSNSLLNLQLRESAGSGIEFSTYPELASSYGINLLIPPLDFAGTKDDWIQYEGPERLKSAIQSSPRRYDVLICDESQDVQPFWWEAVESLLKDQTSKFYLFFDRSQGVFGSGDVHGFVPEDVLPVKPPYFPLVHNYRTTREIGEFSRKFRTGASILQSHSDRLGYLPEIITYKDADDAKAKLTELIGRLTVEEGLKTAELTLLSARNPAAKESILYNTDKIGRLPLHRMTSGKARWADAKAPEGAISVSTIAAFKGLETPVGILLNISEYNLPMDHPIMSSLVYVACTRAKHMLYVFVREDDSKAQVLKDARKSIKTTGSLVVDGAHEQAELLGTITHFNPERLGWLAVDGDKRGSIMFFPYDLKKAELFDIKIGARLRFRPRLEGHVIIASEIKLLA